MASKAGCKASTSTYPSGTFACFDSRRSTAVFDRLDVRMARLAPSELEHRQWFLLHFVVSAHLRTDALEPSVDATTSATLQHVVSVGRRPRVLGPSGCSNGTARRRHLHVLSKRSCALRHVVRRGSDDETPRVRRCRRSVHHRKRPTVHSVFLQSTNGPGSWSDRPRGIGAMDARKPCWMDVTMAMRGGRRRHIRRWKARKHLFAWATCLLVRMKTGNGEPRQRIGTTCASRKGIHPTLPIEGRVYGWIVSRWSKRT